MPSKESELHDRRPEPSFSLTPGQVEKVMAGHSLSVSRAVAESVVSYVQILEKWNRRINLTGVRDISKILTVHFAESFFGAQLLQAQPGAILDIGSGAGFPGLAMKLVCSDRHFYLVEPRRKRAAFLSTVQRELGLKQVTVVNRAIEACQPEDFEPQPSILTMRAVGRPKEVTLTGLKLLCEPRRLLLFLTVAHARVLASELGWICWNEPVLIPWSRDRALLLGSSAE